MENLSQQIWAATLAEAATRSPEEFPRYLNADPAHGCVKEHHPPAPGANQASRPTLPDIQRMLSCAANRLAGGDRSLPTTALMRQRSEYLFHTLNPSRRLEVLVSRKGYEAEEKDNRSMRAAAALYEDCADPGIDVASPAETTNRPQEPEDLAAWWVGMQERYLACIHDTNETIFPPGHEGVTPP